MAGLRPPVCSIFKRTGEHMDLVGIRQKFREITGRYDLVNEDLSDNGANFFINEGVKWLDSHLGTKAILRHYAEGTHPHYGVYVPTELVADTDSNFWTELHPLVLVKAAQYLTLVPSGNNAIQPQVERSLLDDLVALDKDFVEEQVTHIDHMDG